MRRRDFITVIGGTVALWPLAARAQQQSRVHRIAGLMGIAATDSEAQPRVAAFEETLQKLGWSPGRDLEVQYRWAAGDTDLARTYARELIGMRPDVILANTATAMDALHREGSTIPIVFVMVSDPVEMGFVDGVSRPGRNVTGFTPFEPSLGSKWLSLLKELSPSLDHFGIVYNPATARNAASFVRSIEDAAVLLAVTSSVIRLQGSGEMERAFSDASQTANTGLIFPPDAFASANRASIVALTSRYRLPAIYPFRYFCPAGGLMSYGTDINQQFRDAASYVDRILRGTPPGDLPVQSPTRFQLVINTKAAHSLGLTVPATLLARADEVIE